MTTTPTPPTTHPAPVPVSAVLNRAADLIEERGWTYGEGWDHEGGGPLCLEGAIFAAARVPSPWRYSRCAAYAAVHAYLRSKTDKLPFLWNDNLVHEQVNAAIIAHDYSAAPFDLEAARAAARECAKTEVIAVLRAAAVIEAAKESPALAADANVAELSACPAGVA